MLNLALACKKALTSSELRNITKPRHQHHYISNMQKKITCMDPASVLRTSKRLPLTETVTTPVKHKKGYNRITQQKTYRYLSIQITRSSKEYIGDIASSGNFVNIGRTPKYTTVRKSHILGLATQETRLNAS